MSKLPIMIACNDYDRVQPIRDGSIQVEGCETNFLTLVSEEIFERAHHGAQFDVCEMSMSRFMIRKSRGDDAYVGLPVFISRSFRHNAIYIRTDRGIKEPADLRGRLVGVPEYQMTAAFWARGILADEYGVQPSDIRWRNGGLETPGRQEMVKLTLPADVELKSIPQDRTLDELLAAGELDAIIASKRPKCFVNGHKHVARLFPNFRQVEQAYYRKTGIFPIMHLIGIRRELAERHPWLAPSVYKAFDAAKRAAIPRLAEVGVNHDTLPWLQAEVEETKALMGDDYWPYGVAANRKSLDAMLRYMSDQGLVARPLTIDELFVPGADAQFKR